MMGSLTWSFGVSKEIRIIIGGSQIINSIA